MAQDKKKTMQTINDIMGDLNGLANDIGLQLQKDQDKVEAADKNMSEAEDNMSEAQKQLLIKREKLIKKMKRVAACFLCLLIFFMIMFFTTFDVFGWKYVTSAYI